MNNDPTDHDLLIRLDEKVSAMHEKVNKMTDDHEQRIRTLEDQSNKWLGKQAILASAFGVIVTMISAYIRAKL